MTPRECSCIFQVKWSSGTLISSNSVNSHHENNHNSDRHGKTESSNSLQRDGDHLSSQESIQAASLKESARRIKQLEKEIKVEEKLYKGAEALARISTGAQRLEAEKQMEGSLTRMANLKAELQKLRSIESIDQVLSTYDLVW